MAEKRKSIKAKSAAKTTAPKVAALHPEFIEDLKYWVTTNPRTATRALTIVEQTLHTPFTGIGKPELLKYALSGCWSRRLTQEHRIVYLVKDDRIEFLQARYHY